MTRNERTEVRCVRLILSSSEWLTSRQPYMHLSYIAAGRGASGIGFKGEAGGMRNTIAPFVHEREMAPQSQPAGSSNSETQLQPAPSTSRSVEADGLKLNYLDYGTAGLPPMLCIHGGAAHGHWFDFVASGF